MKKEINFYQVDESIIKAMAPLLIKVLDEKKKALVFCGSEILVKEMDASLWSYGRNKFIPHITVFDADFEMLRQPILITNKEENLNKADYLVFLDQPSEAFISSFSRVFHFYEPGKLTTKLKPTNSYKKQDGKWVKNF
jgi:DNA polymerase IIIc chi subunit